MNDNQNKVIESVLRLSRVMRRSRPNPFSEKNMKDMLQGHGHDHMMPPPPPPFFGGEGPDAVRGECGDIPQGRGHGHMMPPPPPPFFAGEGPDAVRGECGDIPQGRGHGHMMPPPPPPFFGGHCPHPPYGGRMRLINTLAQNDNISSRELAELLDIRPSSLTELLARAEKQGMIVRTPDEADKRIVRVSLSDEGRKVAEEFEQSRTEWESRMTACFTDEEAAQFCALSAKLCDHIEKLTGGMNAPDNEEK